ncbi:type III secretion system chaperone [Desulfocurvus sp.]|jgi:hypothetical protein|uniref:type III secretion system chaperone n=1 Tax=Desulfocurvus sp. TaxID=2871698 RepID=UPI0025C4A367|nr:type III secretion system chaperone [Desulfocurvus sp.]MCK9240302.1 type III secretion system chaperone [Desulfocurvus sp.]
MDIAKNAQAILDHVNAVIGGQGLAFDANGVAALTVDGDIACLFCLVEADHELVVSFYLGRAHETDAALLHEMLCGNYMGAYTGGGTLGIDPEENLVALHQHFPLPVDEPAWIEEPLGALVGAARYWRAKIKAAGNGPSTPAQQAPAQGMIRI